MFRPRRFRAGTWLFESDQRGVISAWCCRSGQPRFLTPLRSRSDDGGDGGRHPSSAGFTIRSSMMLRMEFRQFVTSTLARLRRDTLRRRRVRHGTPESLEPRVLLNATLVKDINPLSYSSPSFMAEVNGTLYFRAYASLRM